MFSPARPVTGKILSATTSARPQISPDRVILAHGEEPCRERRATIVAGRNRGRRAPLEELVKIRLGKCLTLYLVLVRIATAGCLVVASICYSSIVGVATRSRYCAAVVAYLPQ